MPICKRLTEAARAGKFGPLCAITMHFGSYKPYDMHNRFFNRQLAGGALFDIGVYALSFVRLFLSSCPDEVMSYLGAFRAAAVSSSPQQYISLTFASAFVRRMLFIGGIYVVEMLSFLPLTAFSHLKSSYF